MAKKKYDPLWEIVDEKIALQGQGEDVDLLCPHCHVRLHLGSAAQKGQRVTCGLCGGTSQVTEGPQGPRLEAAD